MPYEWNAAGASIEGQSTGAKGKIAKPSARLTKSNLEECFGVSEPKNGLDNFSTAAQAPDSSNKYNLTHHIRPKAEKAPKVYKKRLTEAHEAGLRELRAQWERSQGQRD